MPVDAMNPCRMNLIAFRSNFSFITAASNSNGSSGYSNTASATTQSGGSASAVLVDSVIVSTVGIGKGEKIGRATVVVVDDLGGVVQGATVNGEFSGDFDEVSLSADTAADGSVVIDSATILPKGKVGSLMFCVTSVTHSTLEDILATEICGSL